MGTIETERERDIETQIGKEIQDIVVRLHTD